MRLFLYRKIGKISTIIITFMFVFVWIFSGWPQIKKFPPKVEETMAVEMKNFDSKSINFAFTDDNTNENLIIKTDKQTYIGLARGEVYFSVTNIGNDSELVNFQVYFPNDMGNVSQMTKWTSNIPYEVDVPEYGVMSYFCEEGWIEETVGLDNPKCILFDEQDICLKYDYMDGQNSEGFGYQCFSSGDIKDCNNLSEDGQNCIINKVQISLNKEIKYKNDWKNINLSNNPLSIERGFWDKLLGNEIIRKDIPNNLRIKESTLGKGSIIKSNQTQYFKMNIEFLPNTSGEFYIEAIGDKNGYGLLDPWWDADWTYNKKITIDYTKVDATLTNFPVLIDLSSDDSLKAYAQSNGDDIAFIASNETTQLDHEIEYFNSTTGELQAWVEVPSVSSTTDTVIYMYYGNSTCGSQEDVVGTWDSNHKMVHHLNDWTTSTTEDSTSNSNDGTKRLANEPIEISSGKIAQAQSFDGTNDYDKIANTVITSPTALTTSAWIKKENRGIGTYECALHHGNGTSIGASSYWMGVETTSNNLVATIGATTGVGWAAGRITPSTPAVYIQEKL